MREDMMDEKATEAENTLQRGKEQTPGIGFNQTQC